jgi:phosphoglycolate phosphatase
MIKNIIFDMDGTLADTAEATIKAFQRYAPQFCLQQLSENSIKQAIGYANPEFYFRLYPNQDKEKLLQFSNCVEEYEKIIINELAGMILFDDVKALLIILKERNYKLYIASTGSCTHVASVLTNSGIINMFDQVYCDEAEKVSMVKHIIEGSSSKEWVMVGDKQKDSAAARNNHIFSIGAGYGYCTPDDYHLFDKIIQRPYDLLKILDKYDSATLR